MRTQTRIGLAFGLTLTVALLALAPRADAGDGTWTNTAGGTWATAGNWTNSAIADGADATGDFSTINITAQKVTVTSAGSRTIGNLKFGDTAGSGDRIYWILRAPTVPNNGDGILTLDVASGSPVITVNKSSDTTWGLTACVTIPLAGTKGLRRRS